MVAIGPEKEGKVALERTGLSEPVELSVTGQSGSPDGRLGPTTWVSNRLLTRTVDVWSRAYDRPVSTQEAMEILMNAKRFGELLIRTKEKSKT